jgi:hypothetical protein
MDRNKRKRLDEAGWRVGSAEEFLGLSDVEATLVNVKLALSAALRDARRTKRLSQTAVARRLASSQSRVAKMEAADPSVSIDLLLRSVLLLGVDTDAVARAVRRARPARPR